MTTRVRLSGDPTDSAGVIDALRTDFDIAGADHAYPNRGALGVRVYLKIRPRTNARTNTQTRGESTGEKGPTT